MKKTKKQTARTGGKESQAAPVVAAPMANEDWISQGRGLFLIVAATVLAYANSLSGAFVFDDTKQIAGNPALHDWGNLVRAFTSDVWSFQRGTLTADIPPPYYRPLFTAYLTINYQIFGLWEPGWHLANLLVHVLAAVLVYFLLKRLTGNQMLALLAALLFGLHPAHVESVSWISGIPDPLAALFYIPSLLWYVRYREEGESKWLGASVAAFALAVLCKETPLTLPIVLVAWELTREQVGRNLSERAKAIVPQLVPYAVVGVAYLALRVSVLGRISWKHPFMAQVPDSAIWMTVPYVLVNYLRHLIAPFRLSLIYGTSFVTSASDLRFLLPVLLLLGIGCGLWIYRRKLTPQIWVALALTLAPILPVLNLKVFHYEYIIQDRYLYLPSIGFCYLVAIFVFWLGRQRTTLAFALTAVLLLAFGASTILQNRVWHDAVALWQRAIYYSPHSWSTHYNLGLAYADPHRKEYDASQRELLEARRLNPREAKVYNNLALSQRALGYTDLAIENAQTAITLDQRLIEAHNTLGLLFHDKGEYANAKLEFSKMLAINPASSQVRFNMAQTLAAMGDHAGAIQNYEGVLATEPNDLVAHYQLALSYGAVGRKSDAITEMNRALQLETDVKRATEMRKKLEEQQGH